MGGRKDVLRIEHLVDEGFRAWDADSPVGFAGYLLRDGFFYVHSLESNGSVNVAAVLSQAVRAEARKRGFSNVQFFVEADSPALLRLLGRGRARLVRFWLELPA